MKCFYVKLKTDTIKLFAECNELWIDPADLDVVMADTRNDLNSLEAGGEDHDVAAGCVSLK